MNTLIELQLKLILNKNNKNHLYCLILLSNTFTNRFQQK